MLLKLVTVLVVLGVVSQGESSARGLCPKYCKCTYSGANQGVARCTTLDPDTQPHFPADIRHIVVENDPNPKNITASMFRNMGLKKLATVKIVNSSVLSLDVDAFEGLTQLTNVDLSDNRLMLIHPDTFKNNTELRRLILSGNPLQLTQLLLPIGEYVLRSDSLTELYLSRCQMNHLSNRAFSELGNLDVLDLSHNSIRQIDPEVFAGLDQLEELDLSYNELSKVPSETFSNIEDLTSLNLRGNPLRTFDLPNLPELKELDLSDCQFTYLGPTTFEGVVDVNNLNLSHNSINKIDVDAFDSMTNLRYLDLSYNELKGPLDKFLFESCANLETISLAENRDLQILDEFVGEFSSLYLYDISNCGLDNINGRMFKGMHYLATLNASGNGFRKIEPTAFSGLTSLNILDLSNNDLHSMHPNVFGSNHEITKLFLSNNLFKHIPSSTFRALKKLHLLDLSSNMFVSLWNHTEAVDMQNKKILNGLATLNLAGNFIKHLHIFNFFSMVNLQVLDISDNPLECSESFVRVVKWLSFHRIIPNAAQSMHPMSLAMDDKTENYKRWMSTLDQVCPVDLKNFEEVTKPQTAEASHTPDLSQAPETHHTDDVDDNFLGDLDRSSEERMEKIIITEKPSSVQHLILDADQSEEDSNYAYLVEESSGAWSTLLLFCVFCIFILVAVINIGLIVYFRARRNYSLVGYKTSFSGGPQCRLPTRKGQRNAYQKLYEECSVPNTPIIKNGKRLSIISIFGSQPEVPPQNV